MIWFNPREYSLLNYAWYQIKENIIRKKYIKDRVRMKKIVILFVKLAIALVIPVYSAQCTAVQGKQGDSYTMYID